MSLRTPFLAVLPIVPLIGCSSANRSTSRSTGIAQEVVGPKSMLRGVLQEGTQYMAVVESEHRPPIWMKEGDLLRPGGPRIVHITLDRVVLVAKDGKRTQVQIGESLDAGAPLDLQ